MLSSAQRNSRGHVAEELLLQMFQQSLWAMLSLRVKFMGERPCCPRPNGKCRSWYYVAQCSKAMLLLRVTFMEEGHVAHSTMERQELVPCCPVPKEALRAMLPHHCHVGCELDVHFGSIDSWDGAFVPRSMRPLLICLISTCSNSLIFPKTDE